MLSVSIIMLVVLLVAAAVVIYAAYPGRQKRLPVAPWLGTAVEQMAEAVPTLEDDDGAGYEEDDVENDVPGASPTSPAAVEQTSDGASSPSR